MITTATGRVYASGIGGRIGALVLGAIAVPLFAFGVPLLLDSVLDLNNSRLQIAICVGILVIGWLWVLVHVLVTGPIRFETDAQTVRLRKGPRVSNEWRRADTVFASFVERQSTNGIPTGSTRKLIATTATERTEVLCRWFSATTFNELMADLAPVSAAGGVDAPDPAHDRVTTRTFALDATAGTLRGTARSIVAVLVMMGLVACAIFGYVIATDPYADEEGLYFVAGAAVLLGLTTLLAVIMGRRRRARIPSSITVTGSTLQVDGRTLYFTQLRNVMVTPPSYSGNLRRLAVVEQTGANTVYQLGASGRPGRVVFPDYAEFVDLLGRVAPAGVVRFDLR